MKYFPQQGEGHFIEVFTAVAGMPYVVLFTEAERIKGTDSCCIVVSVSSCSAKRGQRLRRLHPTTLHCMPPRHMTTGFAPLQRFTSHWYRLEMKLGIRLLFSTANSASYHKVSLTKGTRYNTAFAWLFLFLQDDECNKAAEVSRIL